MAIVHIDGCEHGVGSASGGGLYSGVVGTVTYSTAIAKYGSRSVKVDHGASGLSYIYNPMPASSTKVVWSGHIYPVSGASCAAVFMQKTGGSGDFYLRLQAAGSDYIEWWDGLTSFGTATLTTSLVKDAWNWVELTVDASTASNWIAQCWVDGSLRATSRVTDHTGTIAFIDLYMGGVDALDAGALYFDNMIVQTGVLTPFQGEMKVHGYSPDAVGVHNLDLATSVHFFKDIAGAETALTTSETISYQQLDDVPLDADTEHVILRKNGATQPTATWYTEHGLQAGHGNPTAVRSIVALRNDVGATTDAIIAKLRANANETNIFSGSIGSTTNIYKALVSEQAPGAVPWTAALLNAATVRYGYSADADEGPRLESSMLEALYPASVTLARPPAVAMGRV